MNSSFYKNALVLGLLSAIGPFAIDMYLPALPSIGVTLNASTGAVQASLMAFFIALGIAQLIYGPVSDMFGRKPHRLRAGAEHPCAVGAAFPARPGRERRHGGSSRGGARSAYRA